MVVVRVVAAMEAAAMEEGEEGKVVAAVVAQVGVKEVPRVVVGQALGVVVALELAADTTQQPIASPCWDT